MIHKKNLLAYITLILGSVVMVLPFLWMISTALKTSNAVFVFPPEFIPKNPTLNNFIEVSQAFPMLRFFVNSLFIAFLTVGGLILVSSMAAYVFARFNFKGKEILFLIYLGTMMVPAQVTLTPLFIVMSKIGWSNTYQALILPGMFSAFGTFLMRQFFEGIPISLDEAAFIDGGSHTDVFLKIIMPLSKPSMATLGVLGFMASWNNFLWPLIITSDIKKMTLPLGLSILQGRWATNWNVLMAGTLITILPILIVYIFAQKYIIKGLSHTGIK